MKWGKVKNITPKITSIMSILAYGTSVNINSAIAQEIPEFEEIIVTARGREETLQSVPLSITVLGKQAIEDARIQRVDDFIVITPGVTVANSQDAGTNFITIRGMAQTRNGEPPVAVIVDGILQINSRSFDQALFDVENIQVLRGPQGARYGRNATGGAIIINTVSPTEIFEGYVRAGIGKGEEYGFDASISGPIITDKLSYRLSASYTDQQGLFTNPILNEKVDFYEDITIRGHLHWTPSDNLSADARLNIVRTNGGSLNFTYQPAVIDRATGLPGSFDFSISDADLVERDFFANNLGRDDRDITQASLRLVYRADWGIFSSSSSYDKIKESAGGDQFPYTAATSVTFGAFPFADGIQSQYVDIEAFSQEVRLTSLDDQRFRWMFGAYFLSTNRFISSSISSDLGQGFDRITRDPINHATNPIASFIADENDNTAYAAFFALDYDLTEDLELSFAGRYDRDERSQAVSSLQGAYADGVIIAPIGAPGTVNEANFGEFQPKVSLRYIASENVALYASWGKGFRSGQFNQNGVGTAAAAAGIAGITDLLGKETTKTYELGFKASFSNRQASLNGALYQTDIRNAPYFVFIGGVGAQVLVPIEDVQIQGGELELSAHITPNINIYAGLAISSSKINEYSVNATAIGNDAPYVPKSGINVGGQYRKEITENLGIFLRADYEYRGRQFWDPENTTARSAIDLVNARFGLEDNEQRWSLIGSVNNLFDEIYNSEWVVGGFAHAGLPRTWRLDLRYNF